MAHFLISPYDNIITMYKKYFSTIILSSTLSINAQEGKVGINTNIPQETLEINGTLRITQLPASGGKIYGSTTATTRNTNFTPTQMVVANENGVLGIQNFPNIPTIPSPSTSVILSNNQYQRAALTGDVTANQNSNTTTVSRIQGRSVSNTTPTNGQVLEWNGTAWAPTDTNKNTYETLPQGKSLDLSSTNVGDLKDLYVLDRGTVITLPSCIKNNNYDGVIISFYKWGSAPGTLEFKTPSPTSGNIFNHFTTSGFPASSFPGMTYTNGTLKFDLTTNNLPQYGFRTYKFICLENNWFLDFGAR